MTCLGILENLISDVLFVLGAILLGWAIYFVTRHTRLIRFFGVTESRRLTIYLSNLRVRTGGAIGIDGQPRSYQGSAVTFGEMQCANRFRDLFRYPLPSIADKPGILSKLLISDVQVELFRSPLTQEELERAASIITLGSPAYNVASRFVERELQSQFWFRTDSTDTSSSDNILAHAQVAGTGAFTTSGSTPDASVTLNPYFGDVGASDTIKSKPAIIG